MYVPVIRLMYGYNRWANEKIFDAAARLTPEQFLAPGGAGRGSIRDTLTHLIDAQESWFALFDGSDPNWELAALDPADYPDVAALRARWETLAAGTASFVAGLSEAKLAGPVTEFDVGGRPVWPLWQPMLHVANHGTQHRSEVAAMLTHYGHSPGDLDLTVYLRTLDRSTGGSDGHA